VASQNIAATGKTYIDGSSLNQSVYFVKISFDNALTSTKKVLLVE
jgi:hypothetical protein